MWVRYVVAAALAAVLAGCSEGDPSTAASAPSDSPTATLHVTRSWGMTGTVKSFDNKSGTGLITPDDGGQDLTVHYKEIVVDGFKTLREGQRVSFIAVQGPQGPQATNVRDLDGH